MRGSMRGQRISRRGRKRRSSNSSSDRTSSSGGGSSSSCCRRRGTIPCSVSICEVLYGLILGLNISGTPPMYR